MLVEFLVTRFFQGFVFSKFEVKFKRIDDQLKENYPLEELELCIPLTASGFINLQLLTSICGSLRLLF